ncbi:MAG: polysaccharide biosynthesis protein, partial [Oscillospiraceae bacterium]|nr:polysaccharide biosynthesis protein [Oscillospiraceae bacterium]
MTRKKEGFLRKNRRFVLVCFDALSLAAAYLITWLAIQGRTSLAEYRSIMFSSTVLFVLIYLIVFVLMGIYDSLWRYAEIYEFFRCLLAASISVSVFIGISVFIYNNKTIPLSVYLMSSIFSASVTLYSRLTYRMIRNTRIAPSSRQRRRVMVVGAGEAASTLLHEIFKDPGSENNVVCAVDDNPQKLGRTIMGVKIMGQTKDIPNLVAQCSIDTILIAIPSAEEQDKRRILNLCSKTPCTIRLLPDITKIISSGRDLLAAVRDIRVEDLLGREEVELDQMSLASIVGSTVMVTGGGGSIGSELCYQIASSSPAKLIIIEISENAAYEVEQNLRMKYGEELDIDIRIASVRDSKKMDSLIDELRPDILFHAAAHKHVPLMEVSPEEAVKNNVCGTFNLVDSSDRYGVKTFVLVSTDKAVNPTSIMGATKRICETILQAKSQGSKTRFVAVRFGNVLGSSGSVIPLFKNQIAAGGPVTVTHPDVVRYFMTVHEAVNLVIRAAEIAKGGEIFILDMGYQVRILDLAENLIRLAG